MTCWVLIPFASVLIAVAFAVGAATWNSDRRAIESMAQVFLCAGGWSLFDLLSHIVSDPVRAAILFGWMHVFMLALGASVLHVVIEAAPETRQVGSFFARLGIVLSAAVAILASIRPSALLEVHREAGEGWVPEFSVLLLGMIALGTIMPVVAFCCARRMPSQASGGTGLTRSSAVRAGILLCLLIALTTDVILPFIDISFPRLGAFSVAIVAAGVWIHSLHRSDDLSLAPQSVARAVLQELREGVAFIMQDGTIFSINERLAVLSGHRFSSLIGMSLTDLIDAPLDLVLSGLQDREFCLQSANGEQTPVSISSTFASEVNGGADWMIVVFHDLRGVDALRRRLLTSGRLAAIGELAAGIAHEVNNPAAFIRSDLNFLRRRLTEIHEALENEDSIGEAEIFENGYAKIDRAASGIERIVEVVDDVRGFSHLGAEGAAESNPAHIIEGAVRLARLERREEVGLHVAGIDSPPQVKAGQDLRQVLLALIRILSISSRVGGSVEISLSQGEGGLCIALVADDLVQRAELQVGRIEMAREDVLEASSTDFGLAIAIELVEQVGGVLLAEAQSEFAMSIDLIWPLRKEESK